MFFICAHPRRRAASILGLWLAAAWPLHAGAGDAAPDKVADSLPDMPGSEAAAPAYFGLDRDSASIGYETRLEKWGAKVDQYMDLNPAVTMDYGLKLTDKLGAGGMFTRQSDYSEVVVNGIYSPKRNLRFRMTGAQLRANGSHFAPDSASGPLLQNSYLFGAKKYWDKYEYLSDVGIAAYSVEAGAPPSAGLLASAGDDAFDGGKARSGTPVPGRLDGYMLNLGLRPTPASKLELRRETGSLSYAFDPLRRNEQLVSNRIKYSHDLGNCLRVQGGYSASADSDRMDLKLTKNNWNIRLSREQESGGSNTAVQFGYAIPLGSTSRQAGDCGARAGGPSAFEPIIDATMQRPQQLPREPLPVVEAP